VQALKAAKNELKGYLRTGKQIKQRNNKAEEKKNTNKWERTEKE